MSKYADNNEIQNLNFEDLDIQELETRLEMSMLESSAGGWVEICGDKSCTQLGCPQDCNPVIVLPPNS